MSAENAYGQTYESASDLGATLEALETEGEIMKELAMMEAAEDAVEVMTMLGEAGYDDTVMDAFVAEIQEEEMDAVAEIDAVVEELELEEVLSEIAAEEQAAQQAFALTQYSDPFFSMFGAFSSSQLPTLVVYTYTEQDEEGEDAGVGVMPPQRQQQQWQQQQQQKQQQALEDRIDELERSNVLLASDFSTNAEAFWDACTNDILVLCDVDELQELPCIQSQTSRALDCLALDYYEIATRGCQVGVQRMTTWLQIHSDTSSNMMDSSTSTTNNHNNNAGAAAFSSALGWWFTYMLYVLLLLLVVRCGYACCNHRRRRMVLLARALALKKQQQQQQQNKTQVVQKAEKEEEAATTVVGTMVSPSSPCEKGEAPVVAAVKVNGGRGGATVTELKSGVYYL